MGLGERIKQKIQSVRDTAGRKLDEMKKEDEEYKKARAPREAERKTVETIAKNHGLKRDKSVKGRYWINDRQYVDVDPEHPGTAARLDKVVSKQKETFEIRTAKPPKAVTVRPGRGKVSRAAQQGDLGFRPRIHGRRPVDPTPDMPPYPGGYVSDGGFIGGGDFIAGSPGKMNRPRKGKARRIHDEPY